MSKRRELAIAAQNRRCQRYAKVGRLLEDQVQGLLLQMKAAGHVDDFVKHSAHSVEDESGKDFTVIRGAVDVSFGVTISKRSHSCSKNLHDDVRQFHFPIGTNGATIKARILRLLDEVQSAH